MGDCHMESSAKVLDSLQKLDKKVGDKYARQALRAAAKVLADAVRALSPTASGKTRNAVKVRAGKRSRVKISYLVMLSASAFGKAGLYAGFVSYGWHWMSHKAKSTGRFVSNALAKTTGGKLRTVSVGKQIEGDHFLTRAAEQSQAKAMETLGNTLTKLCAQDK